MKSLLRFASCLLLAVGALLPVGCKGPDSQVKRPIRIEPGFSPPNTARATGSSRVYIGTYTRRDSKGIYAFDLDLKTGALTSRGLLAQADNPSFLALHPNGRTLYAANEVSRFNNQVAGAVSAYSIAPVSGALTLLGQQSSGGPGPCHISLDRGGHNLLVANYGGGSVACLPLDGSGNPGRASSFVQHTGSSVNPRRQTAPHAHSINVSPDNRHAIAADLGIDKLLIYALDPEKGTLTAKSSAEVAPGAGPRHFAFHPSGRFAYVINELHCTVTAFGYDTATGALTERQTISTLDVPLQKGFSTAEVQVHPNGRFLYGSNRGHDSVAVFAINQKSGILKRVQVITSGGTTPRNFGIDPSGRWLIAANQNSDNLVVYRIDPAGGRLITTGNEATVSSPVCVRFLPVN